MPTTQTYHKLTRPNFKGLRQIPHLGNIFKSSLRVRSNSTNLSQIYTNSFTDPKTPQCLMKVTHSLVILKVLLVLINTAQKKGERKIFMACWLIKNNLVVLICL